jgi:CDP-glucose 4,6-dehydratase
MEPEFWRNKRVLVTGHTGFKGSWLSLWLQSLGAEVVGFARDPSTDPSLFLLANVGQGMVSIIGDINDAHSLRNLFTEYRPEIVFHLAAQSVVRLGYAEPVETYMTNVLGTVNLLESIRQTQGIRAAIVATSDKCYENNEWEWGYREIEPIGGRDPYSSSKACAELVSAAYRASFFRDKNAASTRTALATVRAGNVIGGGDWTRDRLIPDIIGAILERRPVKVRNPNAVRPWQHVLEPLCGYLDLAERLWGTGDKFAEAWNFGPSDRDSKPVAWLVARLVDEWGDSAGWEVDDGAHPHEAHYLRVDSSKAHARLGWFPRWDLDTALRSIVQWHKAHQAGADMKAVVLDQIHLYGEAN